MGLFRLLLLFLIFYTLFRVVLKPFLTANSTKKQNPANKENTPVIDKMIPCATCGTYNASKQAYSKSGKFYCNEACAKGPY